VNGNYPQSYPTLSAANISNTSLMTLVEGEREAVSRYTIRGDIESSGLQRDPENRVSYLGRLHGLANVSRPDWIENYWIAFFVERYHFGSVRWWSVEVFLSSRTLHFGDLSGGIRNVWKEKVSTSHVSNLPPLHSCLYPHAPETCGTNDKPNPHYHQVGSIALGSSS
jgi:hypothetical protein